jgi:stage IV sporulation protein FB
MRSWRIGRAFGIPLFLHPTFLLLPAYLALANGGLDHPGLALFVIVLIVTLFGCVLLHELGHALMARYFGIATRDITIYPIGGVARLEKMSERPSEELLIAIAGPAVNLAILILLAPLLFFLFLRLSLLPPAAAMQGGLSLEYGWTPLLFQFVAALMWGNGILFLFNLIPAFPMDGGRVLRALLALGLGQLRATAIAARVGLVLSLLLGLVALWTGQMLLLLVSLFVAFAGQAELVALQRREAARLEAEHAAAAAAAQPHPAPQTGIVETVVLRSPAPGEPARVEGPRVRPAGFSGFIWDREARVWVRWENGRPVAAYWGPAE